MPVHPARIEDVELFDAERDARPARGRLRPAPDWGSDDLFDAVPRRRFAPREVAESASEIVDLESVRREATVAPRAPRPAAATVIELDAPAPWRDDRPTEGGRRTITITGRPGEHAMPRRERAPSVGAQRAHALAARPDRIMGWACGLGVLLILIALLT